MFSIPKKAPKFPSNQSLFFANVKCAIIKTQILPTTQLFLVKTTKAVSIFLVFQTALEMVLAQRDDHAVIGRYFVNQLHHQLHAKINQYAMKVAVLTRWTYFCKPSEKSWD